MFDVREKTHLETANVPSQDQLQTQIDVSVQYRLIGAKTPEILKNTGRARDVLDVHLIPKFRSLIREQGKSIKRAEDFFLEETQEALQGALQDGLSRYLSPLGVEVKAALVRDIMLPPFITKAIEEKKEREQAAERQKAELERFKTEQQQIVAAAEAERAAAEALANKQRVLADARAYEIETVNKALLGSKSYLKLQALEALGKIARDPSTKLYFLNSDSPNPLPLMHLGDDIK